MIILPPKIKYTGDQAIAKGITPKAVSFWRFLVNQNNPIGFFFQKLPLPDGSIINVTIDRNHPSLVRSVIEIISEGVIGKEKAIQCGFIYWPRNSFGGYFNSPLHGFYPSINQLKHNVGKNKVQIVEDLNARFIENLTTWWTNHKDKFVLGGFRNGAYFGSQTGYCFENTNHWFSIYQVSVPSAVDYVVVEVYDFSETLVQSFTIPDLLSIRHVMANKSANEFVIIGDLQDYNYKTDKDLPFAFDPNDYDDITESPPTITYTPEQFEKRMKTRWEGIARYSIAETGNPLSPYTFTLVDYVEQWRGTAFLATQPSRLTTTTGDTVIGSLASVWSSSVVLYAYYSGDDYKETLFNAGTISGSFEVEDMGSYYNDNSASVSWNFTIDNESCFYNSSLSSVSTHWKTVDSFRYYSKIKPRLSVNCNTAGGYFTRQLTGINLAKANSTQPSYAASTRASGYDIWKSLYGSIDTSVSGNHYGGVIVNGNVQYVLKGETRYREPYYTKFLTCVDPLFFVYNNGFNIFTDIYGSHLVAYADSTSYTPGAFSTCKAYIANADLDFKIDLATVIPYVFYVGDFRGAYYTT